MSKYIEEHERSMLRNTRLYSQPKLVQHECKKNLETDTMFWTSEVLIFGSLSALRVLRRQNSGRTKVVI